MNTTMYGDWSSAHGILSPLFEKELPPMLYSPSDITQARGAIAEANSELRTMMLEALGIMDAKIRGFSETR